MWEVNIIKKKKVWILIAIVIVILCILLVIFKDNIFHKNPMEEYEDMPFRLALINKNISSFLLKLIYNCLPYR